MEVGRKAERERESKRNEDEREQGGLRKRQIDKQTDAMRE